MKTLSRIDLTLGVQCFFTGLVALGAAFVSYRHGLHFALRFGADEATAWSWPLIVDGLLTIATVELWKAAGSKVAGLARLRLRHLALALRQHRLGTRTEHLRHHGRRLPTTGAAALGRTAQSGSKRRRASPVPPAEVAQEAIPDELPTGLRQHVDKPAEQRMWEFYEAECRQGRTPTGADLDRFAGTHNYGRRILRKWRAAEHHLASAQPQGSPWSSGSIAGKPPNG